MARDLAPVGRVEAPEPVVDPHEALRVLVLRLAERDLATRGEFALEIFETRDAPGWTVRCRAPLDDALRIGEEDAATIELRIKSDVGALELAGLSLASLRPRSWKDRSAAIRRSPAAWEARAPTAGFAMAELRRAIARLIEARIEADQTKLRARGVDFDLDGGWGVVVLHVDPSATEGDSSGLVRRR